METRLNLVSKSSASTLIHHQSCTEVMGATDSKLTGPVFPELTFTSHLAQEAAPPMPYNPNSGILDSAAVTRAKGHSLESGPAVFAQV